MAKKKRKSKKGKKKGKKVPHYDVMPSYPYGADPWMEVQPVELLDPLPGHIRTVFSVGLIMPTVVLDNADMKVQDIRQADIMAAEEDELWEKRYKETEGELQEATDTGDRLQDLNQLYEKLLNSNQDNVNEAMKFLHDASLKLYSRAQELESEYRKAQTITNGLVRDKEDHHRRMVTDYEKQIAEREAVLYALTLEHIELRKLEEDRDSMHLSIEELRNGIYENEKQHRRAVMAADEKRRKAQRKNQEDLQAALEEMAQQGFMAAKANIARQSEELSEQTAGLAGLFRWLCAEVRKNRDDVEQLNQLLQDCIVEQDSVAKNREIKQEIKQMKKSIRTASLESSLVERFVVNALVEAQEKGTKNSRQKEMQGGKRHETQLMLTWYAEDKRLPLQALRTTRLKAQSQRYSPAEIPDHEDISQLDWKEKKLIIETVFKYLKQAHENSVR
ncbi:hypothetical protein RvY_05183 [Ramazzottius varieornatus]|uniref:Cilia- and flagella-associated protein 157 n=1 Tax=Ramazzottius varieornatus TaxID=947166 RepID=A0A1D1UX94_RAMVA|nr:hypothetical protein RvY_05183 [Ramazzottius varieornatus]